VTGPGACEQGALRRAEALSDVDDYLIADAAEATASAGFIRSRCASRTDQCGRPLERRVPEWSSSAGRGRR
jgi:hypothetical protein